MEKLKLKKLVDARNSVSCILSLFFEWFFSRSERDIFHMIRWTQSSLQEIDSADNESSSRENIRSESRHFQTIQLNFPSKKKTLLSWTSFTDIFIGTKFSLQPTKHYSAERQKFTDQYVWSNTSIGIANNPFRNQILSLNKFESKQFNKFNSNEFRLGSSHCRFSRIVQRFLSLFSDSSYIKCSFVVPVHFPVADFLKLS